MAKLIWRSQRGGAARAYGDFRAEGLGREPLCAPGETVATTDRKLAPHLFEQRLAKIREQQRQEVVLRLDPRAMLDDYAAGYVEGKRATGAASKRWLGVVEVMLERACLYFMAECRATRRDPHPTPIPRNLATITPPDVRSYLAWLRALPGPRGDGLGAQTLRHHLTALSGVFNLAISDGCLGMDNNPVRRLIDKPKAPPSRTLPLEPHELALLLESARTFKPAVDGRPGGRQPLACAHELLATLLLTGAREDEARQLDVSDLNFTDREIHLRGTKTAGSDRWVPMHPQLVEILRPYVRRLGRISGPLFTTATGERVGRWTKTLDAIAERAGFARGEVRTRRFRVSYATHRCTCDDVDANTVRLELGHGSLSMMERVYARAQRRAKRMGPEFDYRVSRWGKAVEERLAALGPSTTAWTDDRVTLVRRFLASIEGVPAYVAAETTGVSRPAIIRMRSGASKPENLKRANVERMRAYLDARGQRRA